MSRASKSSVFRSKSASVPCKTVVRNCQSLPTVLKEDQLSERSSTSSSDELDGDFNSALSGMKITNSASQPRLCSSIKLAQSLKIASEQKCKQLKELQHTAKPKNLKKINVPFEEKMYKGLIDLKVTEEDIGLPPVAPQSLKPKEIIKLKEPEPSLSDFFKPDFSKEYVVRPNPPEFEISSEYYFTGDQVWKAIKHCEPDPSTMF